jgi:Excalibur calcium-binding domain
VRVRIIILVVAVIAAIIGVGIIVEHAEHTRPSHQVHHPYRDCNEANADGRYNIPRGDPDYRPDLDPDNDGIACEG